MGRTPKTPASTLSGNAGSGSADGSVRRFVGTGASRYLQLASVLRQQIVGGEWPVGHRLPTVEQLADEYGLAKITVRQALAVLASERLTVSERGRGTHVQGRGERVNPAIHFAINDAAAGAETFEIKILEKRFGATLPLLPGDEGHPFDDYTVIRKLHLFGGEPFCFAEFYVATAVFRKFPRGSERSRKIIRLIREVSDVEPSSSRQTVTVEPAGYDLAQLLGCSFAAPVAKVRHNLCSKQNLILSIGSAWYRGDRFMLDIVQNPDVHIQRLRTKSRTEYKS